MLEYLPRIFGRSPNLQRLSPVICSLWYFSKQWQVSTGMLNACPAPHDTLAFCSRTEVISRSFPRGDSPTRRWCREQHDTHARPILQHFESELPFNREPFSEAVGGLAPEAGISCPTERLENVRLSEIHPASWSASLPQNWEENLLRQACFLVLWLGRCSEVVPRGERLHDMIGIGK